MFEIKIDGSADSLAEMVLATSRGEFEIMSEERLDLAYLIEGDADTLVMQYSEDDGKYFMIKSLYDLLGENSRGAAGVGQKFTAWKQAYSPVQTKIKTAGISIAGDGCGSSDG